MPEAAVTLLVVEDRSRHAEGRSFAGRWVVWELCPRPIPHRLYRGDYATAEEAEAAVQAGAPAPARRRRRGKGA